MEAARAWGVPRSAFLAWSGEDRGWAMALLAEEADACSGCGLPRSETHDPEHEFSYRATPVRCHACAAAGRAADAMKQETAGLTYRIERRG